jgi:hypothetical protein
MKRNLFVGMLGLIGILAGCVSVKTATLMKIKRCLVPFLPPYQLMTYK